MGLSQIQIPNPLEKTIGEIRSRVNTLIKQYKSLANYGRPYLEDLREVAVIYYVNNKLGVGLNQLADMIGVDKTSLYKLVKKIEEEHRVAITDPSTKKVTVVEVTPDQLINIVESEILQVTAKQRVADPFMSSIIKRFFNSPCVERQSRLNERLCYNELEKKQAIAVVKEIMEYILNNKPNVPSNPDFWSRDILVPIVQELYKDPYTRYNKLKLLRRIPEFRPMLKGLQGAYKRVVKGREKTTALFYNDYLKLKKLWKNKELKDHEFLPVWLHVTAGPREGWGSEEAKNENLDLDNVKTSLIGLKWENIEFVGGIPILKIYENKTRTWWRCDLTWLDPEVAEYFIKKYYRKQGSIIKTLLGRDKLTVREFKEYYTKLVREISKKLELPFELVPHDLRRSHISILAELGVPMEIAVSGLMDLGVGWENLDTALQFYLRFSKYAKSKIIESINMRKRELDFTSE
jgi:integrase/DNA-binding MarR family transcriptional regulator